MSDYDASQLSKLIDEAPETGFVYSNFGKLDVVAQVLTWETVDGARKPSRRPLKRGEGIKQGESLEIMFTVHIEEFNPALEFSYQRTVTVRKSRKGATGEVIDPSDWSEIVEPSLIKVFGKGWAQAVQSAPYVQVIDEPNVAGKRSASSGKVFGVPKFIAKYASAGECAKAREALQGGARAVADLNSGAEHSGEVPQAVITQVKGLIASVGVDMTKTMLVSRPFGEYDPDQLLAASGVM